MMPLTIGTILAESQMNNLFPNFFEGRSMLAYANSGFKQKYLQGPIIVLFFLEMTVFYDSGPKGHRHSWPVAVIIY